MKKLNGLWIVLFLFVGCTSARAGGKGGGNGGDGVALEFKAIAHNIVDHWSELEFTRALSVSRSQFKKAIESAVVRSTDETLFVKGVEVDAINYTEPKGEIVINRRRWTGMSEDFARLAALVFHEYLGVMGTDNTRFDDFYEISAHQFVKLKSFFKTQYQIQMSFLCLLQTWDSKVNQVQVIRVLQTTQGTDDVWFQIGEREYSLELKPSFDDLFKKTLTKTLIYALYPKAKGQLPDRTRPVSGDRLEFSSGKSSLRIMDKPEIQMSCYQVFEGLKAE